MQVICLDAIISFVTTLCNKTLACLQTFCSASFFLFFATKFLNFD